jgi:hypothetical protein
LENLETEVDVNKAWETIRENTKIWFVSFWSITLTML